jgi:UPF0755 protein
MSVRARLIALTLGTVMCASWYFFFLASAPVAVHPPISFEIAPGATAREVIDELAARDLIRSPRIVTFLARWTGADREFRHGTHEFSGALTPERVLEELVRKPTPTIRVTIPEGMTSYEIGKLLQDADIVSAADYRKAACDVELMTALAIPDDSNCAEGYLFPDTYALAPGMQAPDIVRLQISRFREVTRELWQQRRAHDAAASADGGGRSQDDYGEPMTKSLHETVILASIIEKETSRSDERPLVASVFHNRLRRRMRLQADPTVIYGLAVAGRSWDGGELHRYLREHGPYNTYTSDGLPPGPICNPGREALSAALFPARTDYIYFVATGDGAHRFSETLSEHNRAVARLRSR